MLTRTLPFVAAALALSLSLTASAQQKIAVVDLEKLIRLHPNTAEEIRKLQRDLNAQELKMLKRTSDVIERAIAAYAKGNGIDLVLQLPSKLSPGTGVVYSKPEMDITAAIMELMGISDEEPQEEGEGDEKPADAPAAADAKDEAKPETKAGE